MPDQYKNPLQLSDAIQKEQNRSVPDDIKKGFYDLGYDDNDINDQFGYHKKELIDPDDPREITDEQVYGYMRDHLHDNGILPKNKVLLLQKKQSGMTQNILYMESGQKNKTSNIYKVQLTK